MDALETNGGPADIAEIEQIVKEKMVRFLPISQMHVFRWVYLVWLFALNRN